MDSIHSLKTGVSHTPVVGVSHTYTIGVSHTDEETVSVYKLTNRKQGKSHPSSADFVLLRGWLKWWCRGRVD